MLRTRGMECFMKSLAEIQFESQKKTRDISLVVGDTQETTSVHLYLQFSCQPASFFIFPVAATWQKIALTITLFYMEGDKPISSGSQFWIPGKELWWPISIQSTVAKLEWGLRTLCHPGMPWVLPPQGRDVETRLGKAFWHQLWGRPTISAVAHFSAGLQPRMGAHYVLFEWMHKWILSTKSKILRKDSPKESHFFGFKMKLKECQPKRASHVILN